MNEDIKQEIEKGIEAQKNEGLSTSVSARQNSTSASSTPPPRKNLNMLQDEVQDILTKKTPEPSPTAQHAQPIPTPISTPTPAPISTPTQAPTPTALDNIGRPIQGAEKLNADFVQKPIRTYESDLAEALAKKQTSATTIAIAESKRDIQNNKGSGSLDDVIVIHSSYTKQIVLGFLSIIFIGGGVVGGYYFYEKSAFAVPTPVQQVTKATSIIPVDKQVILTVNSSARGNAFISQISSQFRKDSTPTARMIDFLVQEVAIDPTTNKSTIPVPLSISSFMQNANTSMPDVIIRSLGQKWMLGGYTEDNGNKTLFMALSTDYFQNVFAGMLGWENSMPDDLATLFNYTEKIQVKNLSASSSPLSYFNAQGTFSDKVIRNRDTREFRSGEGELLLLYSFIDKQTLVITTTESAFQAIIDRIEKQTYVR